VLFLPGWQPEPENIRVRVAVTFCFVVLFAASASPQVQRGLIRGTVLTPNGDPVEDAHVYTEVMQGSTVVTVLETNTDDSGTFVFSRLALGKYRVSAAKPEGGYLSAPAGIFNPGPPLTLILTADAPTADTTIHFAPKAGVITGWVLDSSSGSAISAHLSLSDASAWSTTGTNEKFKFRLLIPADTPIRFGACAEGYKPWFYADSSSPAHPTPVQLAPGAELDIDIKLEPNADKIKTPCFSGNY